MANMANRLARESVRSSVTSLILDTGGVLKLGVKGVSHHHLHSFILAGTQNLHPDKLAKLPRSDHEGCAVNRSLISPDTNWHAAVPELLP